MDESYLVCKMVENGKYVAFHETNKSNENSVYVWSALFRTKIITETDKVFVIDINKKNEMDIKLVVGIMPKYEGELRVGGVCVIEYDRKPICKIITSNQNGKDGWIIHYDPEDRFEIPKSAELKNFKCYYSGSKQ